MSRLRVNGQVLYADMTPAENANVVLHDLDLIDGKHDKIYEDITNSSGKFNGRTSEWNDREGRGPFNINIPDKLNLQFTVRTDGRKHKGPFIMIGSGSPPIILPFRPPMPVTKAERELVQVISLSNDYTGGERALYEFIENASEGMVSLILGDDYNRVHVLKGTDAMLEKLHDKLQEITSRTSIEAVDIILNIHGITNSLPFSNRIEREADVLNKLNEISRENRKKFRAFFSTACYGASHLDLWINAGFEVASGSEGIYADSAISFAPFLNSWAGGKPFRNSVDDANSADVHNANDNVVRTFYTATGRRATASSIDSDRIVRGNGNLRIYSKP